MTSFGRGHGWSSQNQDKDQGLHRLGGGVLRINRVLKDIVDKLVSLEERKYASPQLIQEIIDLVIIAINEDSLRYISDSLLKKEIYYSLTTKIAMIFSDSKVSRLEDDNKNCIRRFLLSFLQHNYMFRERYRAEDKKRFANNVLLHAEVYYYMRINGIKCRVLAKPLIEYLENLLEDNPKDNIYFIMIQILKSGKALFVECPTELDSIIMTIRQLLVKENLHSSENYAALLLIIELANNDYEIEDTRVRNFYFSNIKSFSFEYPFSYEQLKVISTTKTENDNQLREVDNQQIIITNCNNKLIKEDWSKNAWSILLFVLRRLLIFLMLCTIAAVLLHFWGN